LREFRGEKSLGGDKVDNGRAPHDREEEEVGDEESAGLGEDFLCSSAAEEW
jgi:hypothetical protein